MKNISKTIPFLLALTLLTIGLQSSAVNKALIDKSQAESSHVIDRRGVQDRIVAIGHNDNKVMEHLDHLANRIGPRQTGSDNYQNACEWARDQFKRFGLSNVHLERVAEIPVGFNRGPSSGAIISPLTKDLHFSTHAWTAGTRGRTRAQAILAPESETGLQGMKSEIEGKWILWRPFDDPKKNESYIRKWDQLQYDVAGVILPSSGELIHTFGSYHGLGWENLPTTPSITLLEKEWNELADLLAEDQEVELEFDIRNYFKKGPIPVYNVVADIPGTELPDEYVIIGAHLDSHDGGTGATDNGTGVAAAMEAARILMEAGIRPRRTIRFVLFAGEEVGMLGSKAYVTDHSDQMDNISAMFNMDQGADYISGIVATEPMLKDIKDIFAPVKSLNQDMLFGIGLVESLPQAITDCCGNAPPRSPLLGGGGCGRTVIEEKIAGGGCGGGVCGGASLVTVPGGGGQVILDSIVVRGGIESPSLVTTPGASGCGSSGCGASFLVKGSKASGGCGGGVCGSQILTKEHPENPDSDGQATAIRKRVIRTMGSSDHAQFLAAGVPSFMWMQQGENPVPYYPHTQKDTYDQVIPVYQQHSSTVIALAAFGVADLDHLLSRKHLTEDAESFESKGSGSFLLEAPTSLIKSNPVETAHHSLSSTTDKTPHSNPAGCCPPGCCKPAQKYSDCCPPQGRDCCPQTSGCCPPRSSKSTKTESGCCPSRENDCCPPGGSTLKKESCFGSSI